MYTAHKKRAFTLIELLVVIAILATLAVVVFVALNPVRRFRETRNSNRATEINEILTAVHQMIVDQDGFLPPSIDPDADPADLIEEDNFYMIGTDTTDTCIANNLPVGWTCSDPTVVLEPNCVDLGADITGGSYIASMPVDPTSTVYEAAATGYVVRVQSGGIITIQSCGVEDPDGAGPEDAPVLVVTR